MNQKPEIDKDQLYGRYQRQEDDDRKFNKFKKMFGLRMAYKSADLPLDEDDPMNVQTHTQNGLGWKELLAIGAIAIGGFYVWLARQPVIVKHPEQPTFIDTDTDTTYGIRPAKPIAKPVRGEE